MRNDSKKTVAMYIRFGRAELVHHNPCKHDSIDWKQQREYYQKEQENYPLIKSGFKREWDKTT